MADLAIGQRIPSALDSYYQNYTAWCERLRIAPADYDAWLRFERLGAASAISRSGCGMSALESYAASRQQVAQMMNSHP
jgi:hypothetical protein